MGNNLTSRSSPLDEASTEASGRAALSAVRTERLGIGADLEQQVGSIREAFGSVPVAEPGFFGLYLSGDRNLCVRREDTAREAKFGNRETRLAYLQLEAVRCSSYRLLSAVCPVIR